MVVGDAGGVAGHAGDAGGVAGDAGGVVGDAAPQASLSGNSGWHRTSRPLSSSSQSFLSLIALATVGPNLVSISWLVRHLRTPRFVLRWRFLIVCKNVDRRQSPSQADHAS